MAHPLEWLLSRKISGMEHLEKASEMYIRMFMDASPQKRAELLTLWRSKLYEEKANLELLNSMKGHPAITDENIEYSRKLITLYELLLRRVGGG